MPVFIDEFACYLLPALAKTYAPCGLTPCLEVCQSYDHLSVIGGITPAGDLYTYRRDRSLRGEDSVRFLQQVQRQIGTRLLVIWDRGPIHRAQAVAEFLAGPGAGLIQMELLPAYAPELNPFEGMVHRLKNVERKNLCCWNLEHLAYELGLAIRRVRRRPDLIAACFAQAGLEL